MENLDKFILLVLKQIIAAVQDPFDLGLLRERVPIPWFLLFILATGLCTTIPPQHI